MHGSAIPNKIRLTIIGHFGSKLHCLVSYGLINKNNPRTKPKMTRRLVMTSDSFPRFVRLLILIVSMNVIKEYTANRVKREPNPIQCKSQAHFQVRRAGPQSGMGSTATALSPVLTTRGSTLAIGDCFHRLLWRKSIIKQYKTM